MDGFRLWESQGLRLPSYCLWVVHHSSYRKGFDGGNRLVWLLPLITGILVVVALFGAAAAELKEILVVVAFI